MGIGVRRKGGKDTIGDLRSELKFEGIVGVGKG